MGAAYPYVAMVLVQLCYSSSNMLLKVALERGLNQFVFVAYRHISASLLLCPFAYVLERRETVTLKTPKGRAKVIGTLISIGGSFIFTLWKGKCLINGHVQRPLIDIYGSNGNERKLSHVKESWLKGSALILLSNFTWSLWLIFQGVVYKDYPAQLSLNALICLFAAFHSSILALFATWDLNLWRLEWNVQLWTIIYSGVVVSALVNNLLIWGIGRKGPVFAAMFHPLQVVIVGIFWCIAFAERFHLGRC
ncbi:hypothetical protein CRG98_010114 [Punica granatum]|uniref:WAT1-related protein n=1 Tax=Punica granatum TaxID=22663 RepID=A0A2I0KLV0_PUNGR|nr:hypothetical protein CRG98_010114 [Punica granatum]